MNAPAVSRMMPGTAWWTCSPLPETLSWNGPLPARIMRVIVRVVRNVTTNAAKQTSNGTLIPPPPRSSSSFSSIAERYVDRRIA